MSRWTSGVAVALHDCSNTASYRWFEFRRSPTSDPMIINQHNRKPVRVLQLHRRMGLKIAFDAWR